MTRLLLALCFLFLSLLSLNAQAQAIQTVNNGATVTFPNYPVSGCIYNWVNSNPSIGLPANGTGNIAPFTAICTGNIPEVATITATPVPAPIAYINNSGNGTVSVVNTATNTIITTITVGTTPVGITTSPDFSRVYVVNEDSNTISVINTLTNAVVATIPVGPFARGGLVVTPDGKWVYFATFGGDMVKIIDATNNTVVGSIPVGHLPNAITISPDGSKVYVGNFNDGTISVINTATNTLAPAIGLGASIAPMALAISLDGKFLYVATQNPDNVFVINTTTNSPIASIPITGLAVDAIAISPDGSRLYVTSQYGNIVSVINTATNRVIVTIPVSAGPNGISVTPDGSRVYVTSPAEVTEINATTNTVVNHFATGVNTSPHSYGKFIINGTFCNATPVTFKLTVNPPVVPTITLTGAPSAVNTIYGTPSAVTSFKVSAANMTTNVLIAPVTGFEISTDNINFSPALTLIPVNGTITNAMVYVRLAATTPAGTYSGTMQLTSQSAAPVGVSIPNSVVSPAPLTIVPDNATKTYGAIITGATGLTGFTATGPKNGETVGSITIAYGTGAAATANAGIYTASVTASAATGGTFNPANYTITYQTGSIIVNKAAITITADNKTKVAGKPNPPFTVTYSGMLNATTPGQVTPEIVTTTATTTSPAGVYPIHVSGSTSPNYTITFVDGILTVTDPALALVIPNTFTPNGDGINDNWKILNMNSHPDCTVDIFNRYGSKVFTSIGYGTPWDGTYNGLNLPTGTYYYLIDLKDNTQPLSGNITIIR